MSNVAVLGSGDYGTAIVYKLLRSFGIYSQIWWYVRNEPDIQQIKLTGHHRHLNNYNILEGGLNINFHMSSDINTCILSSDYVILAIPTAYIKDELSKINPALLDRVFIVMSKGFVCGEVISDFLHRQIGIDRDKIYTLSGPCHAEEMIQGKRNYLTLGAPEHDEYSSEIMKVFSGTNSDIHKFSGHIDTVEIVSAMKNVYAIAAGIADEYDMGDNYKAVLVSQAIREMQRLTKSNTQEILDNACIGDLLVTCYSTHSRNYAFGRDLIRGDRCLKYKPEGYYAVAALYNYISKWYDISVDFPLLNYVYEILYVCHTPHKPKL